MDQTYRSNLNDIWRVTKKEVYNVIEVRVREISELGSILDSAITEDTFHPFMAERAALPEEAVDDPIEPGMQSVEVQVIVTWLLE